MSVGPNANFVCAFAFFILFKSALSFNTTVNVTNYKNFDQSALTAMAGAKIRCLCEKCNCKRIFSFLLF